jgi:uncharacterized protein (DUF2062 family)
MPPKRISKKILNPKFWWDEFTRQLKDLRGKPHEISLGMAIGVFIGITPTIPFHMALAVFLAVLLRASKLAALLGVWVANPVTIPILYYTSYQVGRFVLGLPEMALPADYSFISIAKLSGHVAVAMLHGGVLLAILPAILTYVLTFRFTSSPRFQGTRSSDDGSQTTEREALRQDGRDGRSGETRNS